MFSLLQIQAASNDLAATAATMPVETVAQPQQQKQKQKGKAQQPQQSQKKKKVPNLKANMNNPNNPAYKKKG